MRGRGPAAGYLGSDAWSSSLLFCRPQGQGSEPVLTPARPAAPWQCTCLAAGWQLPASAARHTHKSQLLTHLSTLGRRHHTPRRVPRWGLRGRGRPPKILPHSRVGGRRHSYPNRSVSRVGARQGRQPSSSTTPFIYCGTLWRPRATSEITRGSALAHGWASQLHCPAVATL